MLKEMPMEKRYYSIESLERELSDYEARFGIMTTDLICAYRAGERPEGVPSFDAMVWADAFAEVERLRSRQPQPA
jgi:hypothetical protein